MKKLKTAPRKNHQWIKNNRWWVVPLPYGHVEAVMHGICGEADQLKL
jgi:hypothetical protein